MFVSTCSGCIQVPTPVYYWNPYTTSAVFPKKSPFQISEILQMTQNATKQRTDNSSEKIEYPFSTSTIRKYDSYLRRHADQDFHKKIPGSTTELRGIATHVAGDTNEVINYSKKVDGAKCSLPSALEPLQALCSAGLRGYGSTSPSEGQISKDHSISSSSSPKNLKFGIHRILGEDFGNKTDKENAPTSNNEHRSSSGAQRPCECTYEGCQVYQQMRFPSHALSAVHALQPPRYPTSPSGTDVLPGPYSVLNTDVHIGAHAKRKRSWSRAVFSNLQRKGLEKRFEVQKYVTKPDRRQLAAMLGLTDAQVKVWFQNRRMKWRHAQQQNDEDENDTHPADDNSPELDANSKMLVGDILEDVELVIDETEDIDDLSEVEEHDISDTSERHNTRMDVDTRDQTVTCASTSE